MNKIMTGIFVFAVLGLLGASMVSANGFGFMNSEEDKVQMQNEMKTAIDNEDYESWKALMEEKILKFQEGLTEENFEKVIERHVERSQFRTAMQEAKESGNWEEVKELKEEFGMQGKGMMKGFRSAEKMGSRQGCQFMDN